MTPLVASSMPDYRGLVPCVIFVSVVIVAALVYLGFRHPRWGVRAIWAIGIWLVVSAVVGIIVTATS